MSDRIQGRILRRRSVGSSECPGSNVSSRHRNYCFLSASKRPTATYTENWKTRPTAQLTPNWLTEQGYQGLHPPSGDAFNKAVPLTTLDSTAMQRIKALQGAFIHLQGKGKQISSHCPKGASFKASPSITAPYSTKVSCKCSPSCRTTN